MDIPLISIITVTYNAELLLEETINSVLSQSYKNIEYIIIDGNSTDQTVDIIKKNSNILDFWVSETDRGIYDAMNKGIKVAKGDAILLLNAGDILLRTSIEDLVRFAGIKLCDSIICADWEVFSKLPNNIIYSRRCELEFIKKQGVCHQSTLVGKNIYNEFGLYDTNYKLVADRDFYIRVWQSKPHVFKLLHKVLLKFRYEGLSSREKVVGLRELNNIRKDKVKGYENIYLFFYIKINLFVEHIFSAKTKKWLKVALKKI